MTRGAIYARYSSRNQREQSIEDQIRACREFAARSGISVAPALIFSDSAQSGRRGDRVGLRTMMESAANSEFDVLLVDDLSRLHRDNVRMQTQLQELRFNRVRVAAVADGLDSQAENDLLAIQFRGIMNESYSRDLGAKTMRGLKGQFLRGYSTGNRAYGYRSMADGRVEMRRGTPTPEGYKIVIEPAEAAVVQRMFREYVAGAGLTAIAQSLNSDGINTNRGKPWRSSSVRKVLVNELYTGKVIWNRFRQERQPGTNRVKKIENPPSKWLARQDEELRIIPADLWERAVETRRVRREVFPSGFQKNSKGSREQFSPTHLLSGLMRCSCCNGSIMLVGGKKGGYYGCGAAQRKACSNKVIVQRRIAERRVVEAIQRQLTRAVDVQEVFHAVESETKKLAANSHGDLKLKRAALDQERRKLNNFVEFIARGQGSNSVAAALQATESRVDNLVAEVAAVERARDQEFRAPPLVWVEERLKELQLVFAKNPTQAALAIRDVVGPIALEPVYPDIGHPYYVAHTWIGIVDLLLNPPLPGPGGGEGFGHRSGRTGRSTPSGSGRGCRDSGSSAFTLRALKDSNL